MLMSAMRDKIKVVIFVTLLAFVGLIFFDWGLQRSGGGSGPQSGGVIGEINGQEISFEIYQRARRAITANFEARTGRTAEYGDFDAIEDDTWLSIVQETVVQQQIEKYGIAVSDSEIMEILRTNPPAFLRQNPDFLDASGQFDPIRYSQALADPNFNWVPVEQYIREVLPTDKVQNYVGMSARVTNAEVRNRFISQNEKVQVVYVQSTVAGAPLPEGAVSDADLEDYYREHQGDYRVGKQAVLDLVRMSKAPSKEDTLATQEDLADIREIIVQRGDFAGNATSWSDDPSASRGGDLGFISRGDLPTAFEDVAFSTEVGEISAPFESPFGFHILLVEDRKTEKGQEQVQVRHIMLRVEASNTTLRAARSRADDFAEDIDAGGEFGSVAADLGYDVETTEPFERTGVIPGLGFLRAAQRFAFSNEPGAVTPEAIEDESFLYVFRLAEMREPHAQSFEEVRDRVEAVVTEEKRRGVARAKLTEAMGSSDGSLDSIAKSLGVAVDTTIAFSRVSFVPGVGRRNAFVATAFSLPADGMSELVDSDRGFYVMRLFEHTPIDEATLVEQQDGIRRALLAEKRQTLISSWIENLVVGAEIIDFRGGQGVEWKPEAAALVYFDGGPA